MEKRLKNVKAVTDDDVMDEAAGAVRGNSRSPFFLTLTLTLTPHPSPLTLHPSPFSLHPSRFTHHSSPFTLTLTLTLTLTQARGEMAAASKARVDADAKKLAAENEVRCIVGAVSDSASQQAR